MQPDWPKAAVDGDVALMARLIQDGHDINGRDRYGQTAAMLAAVHCHRELVDVLIAHQADLNVTAKHGLSALMLAVVNGHEQIARALVDAGADLSLRGLGAPGFAGKTAGDLAIERDLIELAEKIRQGQP